ncbi:MAG: ankyrin repeat domain-containing protein [Planctomycetota bacterium]
MPTVGHPTFLSPHASPLTQIGKQLFVVNTPSDTVDVIDVDSNKVLQRISVGVDPVSMAARPDGKELWVANHISDSVSVIDTDKESSTYLHVVATIQDINPETKATRFDEPVGIAFASDEKAYVALSSENKIAVVDVAARQVMKRLDISAQDPRAIKVRNGKLYVIPFESNNKTQLSGGRQPFEEGLETFDAYEHSIRVNNVLSIGHVVDVIKHPEVPDRDMFVFDTETDKLVDVVDTLGTLLFGLAVDSKGQVFVAQTDARNDANGKSGTKKHGLKELENRAFLNQITRVNFEGDKTGTSFIELEPLPPEQPAKGEALATPFAIEVTADDKVLVCSAAGSDLLFTVDAESGEVLGRVEVGAVPRGISLDENSGSLSAWVHNAVGNSVSHVDLSDLSKPKVLKTIELEDPTLPAVKRGRIAFNTAAASTTQTYSCASCHPDGHTDQLLWVLKTPVVTGGNQIMPRSTMPIRGLRDTAPFHWDGIPGDPYGGNNSGNIYGQDEPNSDVNRPETTTRHLIDGGLASTMMMVGSEEKNDEGKEGSLSAQERDDMATFLLSVLYPPAQRRAYTNEVSERAQTGFKLFHIEGDFQGDPRPNVCGDCHRMPFLVSTNTPGSGMDAPTWRGAYDRWLILPQGRLNIIEFDFFRSIAERGIPERNLWQFSWGGRRRFDPIWDMVLEGSTGFSGAFARQLTLNESNAEDPQTEDLWSALETAASEGAIQLEATGALVHGEKTSSVTLLYDPTLEDGSYVHIAGKNQNGDKAKKDKENATFTRDRLISLAKKGRFVATFTARQGLMSDVNHPQPGIWTLGPIEQQSGHQNFPVLYGDNRTMKVSGRHIVDDARIFIDGHRVKGEVNLGEEDELDIVLAELPSSGMHLLQIQNADGMFSNDFIFHVVDDAEGAVALRAEFAEQQNPGTGLTRAIRSGNLRRVKERLDAGARVNGRTGEDGSIPLSTAALHGHVDVAKLLMLRGARVNHTNRDGNTPVLLAAFMCHEEMVKFLLEKGADPAKENQRGESAADAVSGDWSESLANFYRGIGAATGVEIDLEHVRATRPKLAEMLREKIAEKDKDADAESQDSQ